jgi:excisionase family DNA binding protein
MVGAFSDDVSKDLRDTEVAPVNADDSDRIFAIDSRADEQQEPETVENASDVRAEMSSSSAARVLGVSRPTLMKLVNDGLLPSRKSGSHHWFSREAVERLAEIRHAERSQAFAELRELDEALEENDENTEADPERVT